MDRGGIEPPTPGFSVLLKSLNSSEKETIFEILEALGTAVEIDDISILPELLSVIEAWPKLPEAIKKAIMALIRSDDSD